MIKQILIPLFILFTLTTFSQRPGKGKGPREGHGSLSGQVINSLDNKPMEYVNILLYKLQDSSMVDGNITNISGNFKLEKIPFGKYYLVIQFIGFHSKKIENIFINPRKQNQNLGTITLDVSQTNLDAVVIQGERSQIEYQLDKKVVNVDSDMMSTGETAVEVLENVPSVQVDIEGNVTLRGSESFQTLIDGRPSVLQGSDALKQIPASSIKQIEIITNPSAKYSAEGVGGILNIILKKKRTKALDGIINLGYATKNKYSADVLFSRTYQKFTFTAGANYANRERLFFFDGEDKYIFEDSLGFKNSDMNGNRNRKTLSTRGSIEYRPNNTVIATISGKYGNQTFIKDFLTNNYQYNETKTYELYSATDNIINNDNGFYDVNLSLEKKFNDNGHKIEFLAFQSQREGEEDQIQKETELDENGTLVQDSIFLMRNTGKDKEKTYHLQIDYTLPLFKEGRFEAGFRHHSTYRDDLFLIELFDENIGWTEANLEASDGQFEQMVNALYTTFGNTWRGYSYQLGLRSELSERSWTIIKTGETTPKSYLDFFPSVHLSKEFKNKDVVYTSFSRRIRRPRSHQLNPFPMYMNSYNYRIGNLEIDPEYIQSYELGYQKTIGRSFFSLEGFYRLTTNKFTRIRTLKEDGVMEHTFINLDKDVSTGVEFGANFRLFKKLSFNSNISYYYYQLYAAESFGNEEKASTNLRIRLNTKYKITSTFNVQASLFYMGPSVSLQGERKEMMFTNFAIKKEFLDRKLSVSLTIKDIFGTGKHEFITDTEDFYSEGTFRRESPVFGINLSYIINNYKKKREGRGEGGGDMEIDF